MKSEFIQQLTYALSPKQECSATLQGDAACLCELDWHSEAASHIDCSVVPINETAVGALQDACNVQGYPFCYADGMAERPQCRFSAAEFRAPLFKGVRIRPLVGRFYPPHFFPELNSEHPVRVTQLGTTLGIDCHHPLAFRQVKLKTTLLNNCTVPEAPAASAGARKVALRERSTNDGPGMQARYRQIPTDFWSGDCFARDDANPDAAFYARPRFVEHIDRAATQVVSELYRQWIPDHAQVLDLMASWISHVPDAKPLACLTGLGMNRDELAQNSRLDNYLLHDLNRDHRLPFVSNHFDAVICTVSVEYLVQPVALFAEVNRVLKSGGRFIVTFSNRYFPPKVIRVWETLHDFERMGLVLEYFLRSKRYCNLQTWSIRGLPRPEDDKYSGQLPYADPLFAVIGEK